MNSPRSSTFEHSFQGIGWSPFEDSTYHLPSVTHVSEHVLPISPVYTLPKGEGSHECPSLTVASETSIFRRRLHAETANDAFAEAPRIGFDRFFVERQKPAIAHDHAAFDDYRAHVRGLSRINQIGIDVIGRRLVQIIQVDDNQVGALSFFDRSNLFIEVQSARSSQRRHLESLFSRHHLRITADQFVQFRRRVHLFPEAQIIIRRCAVGAEADGKILLEHLRHRRDAGSEFHVRLRVVNDAYAKLLQQAQFFLAGPNHVRGNHAIVEKADAVEIIDGTGAFDLNTVVYFPPGFRDMRHDWRSRAIGKCA